MKPSEWIKQEAYEDCRDWQRCEHGDYHANKATLDFLDYLCESGQIKMPGEETDFELRKIDEHVVLDAVRSILRGDGCIHTVCLHDGEQIEIKLLKPEERISLKKNPFFKENSNSAEGI